MPAEYKTGLSLRTIDDADAKTKPYLEAVNAKTAMSPAAKGVGFIPNLYAALANEPGALAGYVVGYDLFRSDSGFAPAEQEVVMLTISRENNCRYGVTSHSQVADIHGKVPREVTNAIREGRAIHDPKLAALVKFTKVMFHSRGMPTNPDVDEFLKAGFSERRILAIILALAVATLSNYADHIFHLPIDPFFAPRAWSSAR